MGLIHDLAESIVGDITPVDNVSEEDKHTMEHVAVDLTLFIIRMHLLKSRKTSPNLFQKRSSAYGKNMRHRKPLVRIMCLTLTNWTCLFKQINMKRVDGLNFIQSISFLDQGRDLQEFFDSTVHRFKTPYGLSVGSIFFSSIIANQAIITTKRRTNECFQE